MESTPLSLAEHARMMDARVTDLSAISRTVESRNVVLLGVPMYRNIGDLLIHAGTEEFFRRHDFAVAGRFCSEDLGAMDRSGQFVLGRRIGEVDRLVADGASIVFQGGGNFGDLWPHHQRLREAAVARYPNVSITLLPQTAWFTNDTARSEAERAFSKASNLHIFCRDARSLRMLREFAPASLAPDMAHQLWPGLSAGPGRKRPGTVLQSRHDMERVGEQAAGAFDWDDLLGPADGLALRFLQALRSVSARNPANALSDRLWRALADRWIKRAAAKLASADALDTDRLHGMILACLLSKPVHFRDNSYGKLSGYFDLWLKDSPLVARRPHR